VKRYVRTIKERETRLAYARFETEPGHQAQFDWGDFQVEEPSGRTTTVYVFMIVLGFSRAAHVEFLERCTLESFMDGHIRAFRYLQGVPAEILYDNMKYVVVGRDEAGKPIFNAEFLHFAHHYGFRLRLCPPYSPWTKGKVERPIDYLRERFWRGYGFSSIGKTNEDVLVWLDETANRRVHGTHHRPVDERWREEIPRLGPLPASEYDTSLKVFRKVYRDCQLSFNGNRYVVPHRAVGQRVMLKAKNGQLRIYQDQDLLATYAEPATKKNLVADPRFYEALRHDKEQIRRKYGRSKGKACSHGVRVYFTTMQTLIGKLKEPQSKGKAYHSAGLVIVDEAGYLPVDSREAYLFFQFISYRYEKSSTILTSNKSFGDWQELFGDAVIASLLRSRGYGTAYIGKWHLGLEWTTKDGSKAENYYGQDKAFLTCPPLKTVQV